MAASILMKNRKNLVQNLDVDEVLIETLYANEALSERQYQVIKCEKIQVDRVAKLIDFIKSSGQDGFLKFCAALEEDHKWLSEKLLDDAHKDGLCFKGQDKGDIVTLSASVAKLTPSEKQLMKFSKILIQSDWQSVMYELGLDSVNIEQCQRSHSLESMKCMSALILWLRKAGHTATCGSLLEALENADSDIRCRSEFISIVCNR